VRRASHARRDRRRRRRPSRAFELSKIAAAGAEARPPSRELHPPFEGLDQSQLQIHCPVHAPHDTPLPCFPMAGKLRCARRAS
jgi:hypothetical protein